MRALGFILLLALVGSGYWLYHRTTEPSVEVDGPGRADPRSRSGAGPDLVSTTTGSSTGSDANSNVAAKTGSPPKIDGAGSTTPSTPTPEGPMSGSKRAEITQHWKELCESVLSDEEFARLMRENMEMFGDIPDPDQDAPAMLRGLRALTGNRLGIDDPRARASVVEGGLPLGDSALRNLPMAIREGNVRLRLSESGQDARDGPVRAAPHDAKTLRYAWRVGNKVMNVEINRRAAAAEILDLFDPDRRQG